MLEMKDLLINLFIIPQTWCDQCGVALPYSQIKNPLNYLFS